MQISKQRRLRDLFISGSTARAAARVVGINRMTGILFFRKLREKIATDRIAEAQKKIGAANEIVEVNECYTSGGKGGRKVAKQGRGLNGKIAFAGAIERNGRRIRIERIICASRNVYQVLLREIFGAVRPSTPTALKATWIYCPKVFSQRARSGTKSW